MTGPRFFETRMGVRFFEMQLPALVKAAERIAAALEERQDAIKLDPRQALSLIHALLDGTEWTPDTIQAIAEVMERAGYKVSEP